MRIACSRCQTHYDVPDAKLRGGAVKVRCTQCGNTFLVRRRAPAAAEPESAPVPEQPPAEPKAPSPEPDTAFGDLDLTGDDAGEASEPEPSSRADAAPEPGSDAPGPAGDDLGDIPALGELDLGDFEDLLEEEPAGGPDLGPGPGSDPGEGLGEIRSPDLGPEPIPEAGEDLEPVRDEDLLPPKPAMPVQGIAEEMPPLDLQRGPRRDAPTGPRSRLVARDHKRSPLFWIVLVAVVATAGFTAYNLYSRPEAFTFLSPDNIRALWQQRKMEAELSVQNVRGYYRDVAPGRRVFVIRGEVLNRSKAAQSLVQVRGNLFGPDGRTVASRTAYCGNVIDDAELPRLSAEAVDARLQNQVGDALSNVDIAPNTTVPFVVVFPEPPEGVEKYNAEVADAQAGSGS